ncbi:hypothetical protein L5G28_15295 [Gordonia sp. HY285]|uniref:hypothetical protein n=1 Tax=Gordonia liuliyuniae TaxID=2911517 RepID=UPI001F3461D0|nr:hypothetical protein [Gordonia liuliyuniae]MCF8611512.1 hypothetical protein [Gordonia liuliyuniae]
MYVRLTTSDSPADPAIHGVLAGAVSATLGISAHAFGGGFGDHRSPTSHLLILGALAVVVGVARAGQVQGRRRFTGSGWAATAAALVGGQAATHVALAMLGHGAVTPTVPMLVWHAVALPVAVGVLVVAERLARACGSMIAVVRRLADGPPTDGDVVPTAARPVTRRAYSILLQSATGVRGPPAMV